jgi:cytoskeletal protein CcmA (bactofilin family)
VTTPLKVLPARADGPDTDALPPKRLSALFTRWVTQPARNEHVMATAATLVASTDSVGETLITANTVFEGRVTGGAGDVLVVGRFKGDIRLEGRCRVDSGARLEGNVIARDVVVAGEFQGNVTVANHVEVMATGVIVGVIKAASLSVSPGSRFSGHVDFGDGTHVVL